jgi:Tat protein translocase TatB subunit
MFGIGTGELLLLLVIALLVLGPERMPKLARDVGRTVADLRKTSDELRTEFLNADQALKGAGQAIRDPDKLLDLATKAAPRAAEPTITPPAPPDKGATQGDVMTDQVETAFDREAREARGRLEDPDQHKT